MSELKFSIGENTNLSSAASTTSYVSDYLKSINSIHNRLKNNKPEYKEPKFGGGFYKIDENNNTVLVYIKQVIYNAPATIVFWSDGTKTVSKCDKRDEYNPEMGLLLCYLKKINGSNAVNKLLSDWSTTINKMHNTITLSDVRKKHN